MHGARSSAEQTLQIVKAGGTIVYIGLTPEATFPVMQIVRNEITLKGLKKSEADDLKKKLDLLKGKPLTDALKLNIKNCCSCDEVVYLHKKQNEIDMNSTQSFKQKMFIFSLFLLI